MAGSFFMSFLIAAAMSIFEFPPNLTGLFGQLGL